MNRTEKGIVAVLGVVLVCALAVYSVSLGTKNDRLSAENKVLREQVNQLSIQQNRFENELSGLQAELKDRKESSRAIPGKRPSLFGGHLRVGDRFPHFRAKDSEGATVDTESFTGKVLLLHFSDEHCPSCLEQLKHIVTLYSKYREMGLVVLNIDVADHGSLDSRRFFESVGITIPYRTIVSDDHTILDHLEVTMLPATLVVDPSGVLILKQVGWLPKVKQALDGWLALHHKARQ
jgi:peroxiredoxin